MLLLRLLGVDDGGRRYAGHLAEVPATATRSSLVLKANKRELLKETFFSASGSVCLGFDPR